MTASNPEAAPESEARNAQARVAKEREPAQIDRFTRIHDVDWVQLGVLLCCALALLVIWLHYRLS
jgi:hypothetical protein